MEEWKSSIQIRILESSYYFFSNPNRGESNSMDELKRAYETMGLPENASKEEVDKRYTTLMRQARARQRENPDGTDQADFEEVTRAYRYILGEDTGKPMRHSTSRNTASTKKWPAPRRK